MTLSTASEARGMIPRPQGWMPVDNCRLLVDTRELRQAATRIGAHWPIYLEFTTTGLPANCDGVWIAGRNKHRIHIRPGLTASQARLVICHELAHCAQAERTGGMAALRHTVGVTGIEAEAEHVSHRIQHTYMLGMVRPNYGGTMGDDIPLRTGGPSTLFCERDR